MKILWNGNWRETAITQYPYSIAKWLVQTLPRWQMFGCFFPKKNFKWEKNRENFEICYFRNLSEHNLKHHWCLFPYIQHDFQADNMALRLNNYKIVVKRALNGDFHIFHGLHSCTVWSGQHPNSSIRYHSFIYSLFPCILSNHSPFLFATCKWHQLRFPSKQASWAKFRGRYVCTVSQTIEGCEFPFEFNVGLGTTLNYVRLFLLYSHIVNSVLCIFIYLNF